LQLGVRVETLLPGAGKPGLIARSKPERGEPFADIFGALARIEEDQPRWQIAVEGTHLAAEAVLGLARSV
jgi:hypothetical protein